MFVLQCMECGFSWKSESADVYECPCCESKDIVVLKEEK